MRNIRAIREIRAIRSHSGGGATPFAFDNALTFDGFDDFVSFTSSIVLSGPFIINFWIKLSAISTQVFVCNSVSSSGYVAVINATTIRVNLGIGSKDFTVPSIIAGTWVMCSATRDGSNNLRVYTNAIESTTGAQVDASSGTVNAISGYSGGSFIVNGAVDEAGISMIAPTGQNIIDLYNGGNGNGFTAIMGANDLNYHFNESGTDIIAVDSGGSGNGGALINFGTGMWNPH